ncbi:pentatricopeptide repeat-containing protein At4g25270, chloroplastic-like [Nicotiana tabacum]|uniref:Pentatricopeptide repeat-containing protein At4g25270, chloroplastic-like n=2 Tax=Nicotiana tabacum TaxID=4097 RepID=A0A1S4CAY1_TOBAC|nr:PREDICTED: pentatricopeptide repeat-containing protein At4g25270, chloroplastic-like [Nicotiana tabacum]
MEIMALPLQQNISISINFRSPYPCAKSAYPTFSFTNENTKIRKLQNPKQTWVNRKTHISLPKSRQNQLVFNQRSPPKTKLEALETVITKLESTVNNGTEVNDPQIFASLLETCFNLQAIDHGIRVHRLIPEKLLRKNVGISSKLIRLYACSGQTQKAHELFDKMPKRNASAFPWNSIISGYAENGLFEDALAIYFQMVEEGVEPDCYTFPRALKACGGVGLIHVGEEVHRHVIRRGLESNGFILNALVDMYAKCGDIVKARKLFDQIGTKDLVSWNSMLIGYIRHELISEAFNLFRLMIRDGILPDSVSISALLVARLPFSIGKQIHGWVLRRGTNQELSVVNSLVDFYSDQKKLKQVRWLFEHMHERDVVSWNSVISAHSKHPEALSYFEKMVKFGAAPDGVTFVSLLSTCAHLGKLEDGERLFRIMKERYDISPRMEHYSCMVNLYGRIGLIDKAFDLVMKRMEFEAGPTIWGALLYACYRHSNVKIGEIAAERLFELEPDNEHNFELLMKIYNNAGLLEDVKRIKLMMVERGLDTSIPYKRC